MSAYAGLMSGSSPEPLDVTASGGTSLGLTPSCWAIWARAFWTALSSSGEFGPRLVPPDASASYDAADGRGWNHWAPLNSWPIRDEPTSWPWYCTNEPLALSWNATWPTPVMTSG